MFFFLNLRFSLQCFSCPLLPTTSPPQRHPHNVTSATYIFGTHTLMPHSLLTSQAIPSCTVTTSPILGWNRCGAEIAILIGRSRKENMSLRLLQRTVYHWCVQVQNEDYRHVPVTNSRQYALVDYDIGMGVDRGHAVTITMELTVCEKTEVVRMR